MILKDAQSPDILIIYGYEIITRKSLIFYLSFFHHLYLLPVTGRNLRRMVWGAKLSLISSLGKIEAKKKKRPFLSPLISKACVLSLIIKDLRYKTYCPESDRKCWCQSFTVLLLKHWIGKAMTKIITKTSKNMKHPPHISGTTSQRPIL